MEIRLYIARHAHASEADSDYIRPLSEKGHRQMDRLCKGLAGKSAIEPTAIWHSGLTRADETAQRLKEGLQLEPVLKEKKGLAPFDDPELIAKQLDQTMESVLLAGHEPNLSRLAALLLSENEAFERVLFPKASILCLSRLKVGTQSTPWQIEWHINHRLFK